MRIGAEAYARIGTEGSTGPRLFCLSGHVERPGVYEHEHGVTLREVLDTAGGMRDGRPLQAVLLGGAAGVFVGPDELDIRLTFEDARAGGYTLGSGVVMAFDDTVDLADICLRIARFFRDESCGQCVPCRVGTVRQEEALHRLASGAPLGSAGRELALLEDVAAGDARRLDLRPRPDGVERDPFGDGEVRRLRRVRPRRGATDRGDPVSARGRAAAAHRPRDRRADRPRPPGRDDPRRVPGAGDRHADHVLRGQPDAGERLPRLRRRGRGLARPRPGVLASGGGRHEGARPTPTACGTRASS